MKLMTFVLLPKGMEHEYKRFFHRTFRVYFGFSEINGNKKFEMMTHGGYVWLHIDDYLNSNLEKIADIFRDYLIFCTLISLSLFDISSL